MTDVLLSMPRPKKSATMPKPSAELCSCVKNLSCGTVSKYCHGRAALHDVRRDKSRLPSGIFAHHKDRRACRCTQHRRWQGRLSQISNTPQQHNRFKVPELCRNSSFMRPPVWHACSDVTTL